MLKPLSENQIEDVKIFYLNYIETNFLDSWIKEIQHKKKDNGKERKKSNECEQLRVILRKCLHHFKIGKKLTDLNLKKVLLKIIILNKKEMKDLIKVIGSREVIKKSTKGNKSENRYKYKNFTQLKNLNIDKIYDFFILGYKNINSKKQFRDNIFNKFKTCPYCNYNYLSQLNTEEKARYDLELDHYFPKSKYPYLAISILNLIPSCPVCNRIKGIEENHLYPYEDNIENEAHFKFNITFKDEIKKLNSDFDISNRLNLKIDFFKRVELKVKNPTSEIGKRIEKSKEIFQLEYKYSNLKEEMKGLYFKHLSSSVSQMEELKKKFSILGLNDEEIKEIYYGVKIKPEEYHKRPLSKFINDLIKDLEEN